MPQIIVGLGNPGAKYAKTRHNAGWLILDRLADQLSQQASEPINWQDKKDWSAQVASIGDYLLVKPQTMMNDSGRSVRAILDYHKLLQDDLSKTLLVIQDELDLPNGTTRWSTNSRAAGHRGIQSIIDHLGTQNFNRLRIGIQPTLPVDDTASYVLKNFSSNELAELAKLDLSEYLKLLQ